MSCQQGSNENKTEELCGVHCSVAWCLENGTEAGDVELIVLVQNATVAQQRSNSGAPYEASSNARGGSIERSAAMTVRGIDGQFCEASRRCPTRPGQRSPTDEVGINVYSGEFNHDEPYLEEPREVEIKTHTSSLDVEVQGRSIRRIPTKPLQPSISVEALHDTQYVTAGPFASKLGELLLPTSV